MVIVAAISGSEGTSDVAARGDELAQAFDDELHLVHVIEESEYTRLVEKQSSTRETDTGSVEDNAAAAAADGLDEVITSDYSVVGRVGNPGKKVVEYVNEVDARYLVVGGRARSPVGKALFGSVTQSILLNAERPVVTVTSPE
ncbi:universal stress protein [Halostella sp. JP-L12]|uniref:universal stress protein n=1 Tax=Halostella TaxID=1843185 RepID=UPI000EF7A78E|nr:MULTISPECIES: universal stress protein [Halostella]NHN49420.1 universal stress protein [Halostella sp. JP-L12]